MKRPKQFHCLLVLAVLCAATDSLAQSREIGLSEVFSTSKQKELQSMSDEYRAAREQREITPKYRYHLEQIYKGSASGASNVFLVEAPDIDGAVSATVSVLIGGRSADKPATINQPRPPRGTFWLVAFLGMSGSSPPQWNAESILVTGNTIRFTYRLAKPGAATKDDAQYIYWVPLGKLDRGVYQLELYDSAQKATTLERRVVVNN